jgi:SAM-dependent methyltransferase
MTRLPPAAHTPRLLHRRVLRRLGDLLLDKWTGMETAADVGYQDLEFGQDRGLSYRATNWFTLLLVRQILKGIQVSGQDVFVDFGSGKGRVLYLAAHYPFRTVIGVEISDKLNRIARKNLEKHLDRFVCKDVQLVTSDVAHYDIPDALTVAYFNNPFLGAVFTGIIDRICESLKENPREFRIIYFNPMMHDYVLHKGFRLIRRASIPSVRTIRSREVFVYGA